MQSSLYEKPYSCSSCHMHISWSGYLEGGLGVEFTYSLPGLTNTLSLLALCPQPRGMRGEKLSEKKRGREEKVNLKCKRQKNGGFMFKYLL